MTLLPLYPIHAAAVPTYPRSLSSLRCAATMPSMETNTGDGFSCANVDTASHNSEHSAAMAMEATLIVEPNMDDFTGASVPFALAAPGLRASLHAGDTLSLSLSMPGLTYLFILMTPSDDGDLTAHLGFWHVLSNLGYSESDNDNSKLWQDTPTFSTLAKAAPKQHLATFDFRRK